VDVLRYEQASHSGPECNCGISTLLLPRIAPSHCSWNYANFSSSYHCSLCSRVHWRFSNIDSRSCVLAGLYLLLSKASKMNVASRIRPLINQEMQVSAAPLPVLPTSASAPHELYGNTQGDYNPQLPTNGNTSQISRSELQMQSPQNAAFPTIKRKEMGGDRQ
jgi:hypothetical protein